MAWSIFTQGGGDGAAAAWAKDELTLDSQAWGVNVDTPGNEQFVYDWEKSEGGGGVWNPVNQGPDPAHPELTTTGSQYGGGAADYASLGAGLQGTLDYLDMPYYSGVKAGLMNNDPAAARAALIASPWAASHYNNGSSFSTAPLPGQAATLTSGSSVSGALGQALPFLFGPGGVGVGAAVGGASAVAGGASSGLTGSIKKGGAYLILVGGGAALVVAGFFKMANPGQSIRTTVTSAAKSAGLAAAAA